MIYIGAILQSRSHSIVWCATFANVKQTKKQFEVMKAKVQTTKKQKSIMKLFNLKNLFSVALLSIMMLVSVSASAHCDSYDGPVIKEALRALDTNNVELVYKWISPEQEAEIAALFDKTYSLKDGDKDVYQIVERHFLETLVRLHRETEGASYTGIKPAGSMTPLVEMADNSLANKDVDLIVEKVTNHLAEVIRERYAKAIELSKTKDISPQKGREYVHAYVEYTHTLEALEHLLHGEHTH